MGFLRRIFGLPKRKDKLEVDKTSFHDAEAEDWLLKTRSRRMGNLGIKHMELQMKDFLHVLNGAIQEVEVLKEMLKEKGFWDEEKYKELRIKRMIRDGAQPRKSRSMYSYTLNDSEFLRHMFDASEDEVRKFENEARRESSP